MDPSTLNRICDAIEYGNGGAVVIEMDTARARYVPEGLQLPGQFGEAVATVISTGQPRMIIIGSATYFVSSLRL
ncbi:MAG: hypothetical protein AAGG69_12005 [Pseudomonadota bacterium]